MLNRFLFRLLPKAERVLGFKLARELDYCSKDIMAILGVADFHRDYEDSWEWVEGTSPGMLHVNISRPHNRKTGDYDEPVTVHIKATTWRNKSISDYAQQIADRLGTEVWIGEPVRKDCRHYDFDIRTRFFPKGAANSGTHQLS